MPSPRLGSRLAALALLGLASCTYVTKSQIDAKYACLDEDDDGAVKEAACATITDAALDVDCDDANPARAPRLTEIAYDGIDNDCDGFDLLDVDNDNHPGIAQADWQSNDGEVTWPTTLSPLVDCDDQDNTRFPNNPAERCYDAFDSDCEGGLDADFDCDGDGYVIREDLLPPDAGTYEGELPGGDCDDEVDTVNPGVSTLMDAPYDGVDSNCDGRNDFDVDGDAWMPDSAPGLPDVRLALQAYMDEYGYDFPEQFGDCNDDDEFIYPSADDTWYDDIDSNCLGDDDYDADLDGYVLRADLRPIGAPPYTGALPDGDCDDGDIDVFPGALEALGDTIDSDCDGGVDIAPFAFSDFGWTNPRPPVVGMTDRHYLLTTAADQFDNGSVSNNVAMILIFGRDVGPGAPPLNSMFLESTSIPLPFGSQLDAVFGEDRFWVAASHQRNVLGQVRSELRVYRLVWNELAQSYIRLVAQSVRSPTADPYTGLDLEQAADGSLIAVGCGANTLHVAGAETNGTGSWVSIGNFAEEFSAANAVAPERVGHACFVAPNTSGGPEAYVFNDVDTSVFVADLDAEDIAYDGADTGWSAYEVSSLVQRRGLRVLAGSTAVGTPPKGVIVLNGRAVVASALGAHVVHSADAVQVGGTLYIAAVVEDRSADGRDDLVLLYGPPSNLREVTLPLSYDYALSPTGVSLHVDAERVFLGIAAEDARPTPGANTDVVGWVILRP